MAYQSLYRKYRPQRFGELVGQEHVVTALRNAVRDERVGHAYLFSGPRGTGKTTTARILAKALNCLDRTPDGDACGVCENCVGIRGGQFLDLFELDAASNNKVEEMRELIDRVHLGLGNTALRKVYVIDEVHMLSTAASNALLKTLEEPPEHVVFILATTEPERMLATIRSRTQHYEFTLYSIAEIAGHLADVCAREGADADPAALEVIARAATGSMRDALSLLEQAIAHGALDLESIAALFGGSGFDLRMRLLDAIANEDVPGVIVGLAGLLDAGHDPRRVTEDLLSAARDAFLLTSAKGRVRVDAPDDQLARLGELGEQVGPTMLVRVLETLGQAIVDMRGTDAADPRLVLEIALVRLTRREAGPPLQVLLERIERLERGGVGAGAAPERTVGTPTPGPVPAPAPAPAPGPVPAPASAPAPARSGKGGSLGAIRAERGAKGATEPVPAASPPSLPTAPEQEPVPAPPAADVVVELDDVVLAWAAILPGLPPATKGAVRDAQPIAVADGVITLGVPSRAIAAAKDRMPKVADTIRDALSARLGATLKFKLVEYDGFEARGGSAAGSSDTGDDAPPATPSSPVDEPPVGEPPPDDLEEDVDLADLVDAGPDDPGHDSVSKIAATFDATVVEERLRE